MDGTALTFARVAKTLTLIFFVTLALFLARVVAGAGWSIGDGWTAVRKAFERPEALGLLLAGAVLYGLGVVFGKVSHRMLVRGGDVRLELRELDEHGQRRVLEEVRGRVVQEISEKAEPSVILDELLRGALLVRASDLHLNPGTPGAVLTYRIHGALHEVVTIPSEVRGRLAQRLKVLANIDPYARDARDGKIRRTISGIPFEARVSVLPAEHGDRLVLRFVSHVDEVPKLDAIGLDVEVVSGLESILGRGQGILFVSGPVGSGKTTTLYSALSYIQDKRGSTTSLVTLEDPIERLLPFATQSQIDPRHGRGFAPTLRSVLRQDPNVLMIGEIRDEETAKIALQAGLTGHLILTTIHVESAAGTFARLFDMGVAPFVVTNATAGCLSQRLLRLLCHECKAPIQVDSASRAILNVHGFHDESIVYFEARGCPACEGQGYVGRTPVAELMLLTPDLRQAVLARLPSLEVAKQAEAAGMKSLAKSALEKAASGQCSLKDALAVAL